MSNVYIWLNGEIVNADGAVIPHKDAGFLRGLGVFDTLLGDQGTPVKADLHFQRLIDNVKTVLLHDLDVSIGHFTAVAEELLQKNELTDGKARVRTQVTSGLTAELLGKPIKPLIMMSAVRAEIPETPTPVHLKIVRDFPRIANCIYDNCKRLDYSRSYIAKQKALALGGTDALLSNTEGNMACATTSNMFIREGDEYITPPLSDGVLNGIARRGFIAQTNAREESISEERLMAADAVYLTNSILGIRQVASINDKEFTGSDAVAA